MQEVISSAPPPTATALPDCIDEADALELQLYAVQIGALAQQAEIIAAQQEAARRRFESKYAIGPGATVDIASRKITRVA